MNEPVMNLRDQTPKFSVNRASVLIETAFIAPALVGLTLGGVEVGAMYAKQTQLQQVASNAMEIILTAAPKTVTEGETTIAQVRAYAASATGLRRYLDSSSKLLEARRSAEAVRGLLDAALAGLAPDAEGAAAAC